MSRFRFSTIFLFCLYFTLTSTLFAQTFNLEGNSFNISKVTEMSYAGEDDSNALPKSIAADSEILYFADNVPVANVDGLTYNIARFNAISGAELSPISFQTDDYALYDQSFILLDDATNALVVCFSYISGNNRIVKLLCINKSNGSITNNFRGTISAAKAYDCWGYPSTWGNVASGDFDLYMPMGNSQAQIAVVVRMIFRGGEMQSSRLYTIGKNFQCGQLAHVKAIADDAAIYADNANVPMVLHFDAEGALSSIPIEGVTPGYYGLNTLDINNFRIVVYADGYYPENWFNIGIFADGSSRANYSGARFEKMISIKDPRMEAYDPLPLLSAVAPHPSQTNAYNIHLLVPGKFMATYKLQKGSSSIDEISATDCGYRVIDKCIVLDRTVVTAKLYDLQGRIVGSWNNIARLDCTHLPVGVYLLEADSVTVKIQF